MRGEILACGHQSFVAKGGFAEGSEEGWCPVCGGWSKRVPPSAGAGEVSALGGDSWEAGWIEHGLGGRDVDQPATDAQDVAEAAGAYSEDSP